MSKATEIIRKKNPNASIERQGAYVVGVEDVDDTEGRLYRVAYFATPDGTHAIAYCLQNPHASNPYPFTVSHVRPDGYICLVHGSTDVVEANPIDLATAIERTRYWAIAFTNLLQTGNWVDP